jgi:sulfofructose kinase
LPIRREQIIDTSGAGDVFHGAYLASFLAHPHLSWHDHFCYARAASAHKIQCLGNEAGLPGPEHIEAVLKAFAELAQPA